jgi:Rod binding domain-containing protein
MAAHILPPTGAIPATSLPADQVAKAAKAAQDFEAMALGQMLAPMFDTVDTAHGAFGGGAGEEAFRPMLVNEMAKHVAAHGGLGLAAPTLAQMLRTQEARLGAGTTMEKTPE